MVALTGLSLGCEIVRVQMVEELIFTVFAQWITSCFLLGRRLVPLVPRKQTLISYYPPLTLIKFIQLILEVMCHSLKYNQLLSIKAQVTWGLSWLKKIIIIMHVNMTFICKSFFLVVKVICLLLFFLKNKTIDTVQSFCPVFLTLLVTAGSSSAGMGWSAAAQWEDSIMMRSCDLAWKSWCDFNASIF